jgi:tRNA A37 methylthiotransferase MiaB
VRPEGGRLRERRRLLSASGFRMVADPEGADAVIVNTCALIEAK